MPRLLVVAVLIVLALLAFNFQSLKRDIAYKFNLTPDALQSCCSEAEVKSSTGEFDERANVAIFNSEIIDYPKTSLAQINQPEAGRPNGGTDTQVLGTTNADGEEKWVEVSLSEQKVRAWEGNRLIMDFPISSGKWAQTPKGTFNIWYKTRSQKMEGGSKDLGTYYNLPNVPHNMFFYKGYALHGAYWHNNFGTPMSHGCVNEPLANAEQIFAWAGPVVPEGQNYVRATPENPGTRVLVH